MAKISPSSLQFHRRHRTLPLFLLLLLASFLIYSYSNSLLPFSSRYQRPNATALSPRFTFTIKVLAYDRISSLRRCLRSLSTADYASDKVNLHIFLDHFKISELGNSSDLLDGKIEASRSILKFLDGFEWPHGEKMVHYRTGNAGLQAQWLEAWWPGSEDEFAFVVEDDLELSPIYYKFLKRIITDYYYDSSNFSPSIFGASLQRARFVPGKHGNKIQLDEETHLFLYQLVGTWGQLLFPKPWKEFRLWYDEHKSKGIPPLLEGMVTNGWYKKMGEKIWTPWFIKFIHTRGYFNVYTNFKGEKALSVSHRDTGVNYGKSAGPDSILMDGKSVDFHKWKSQPLKTLKWYDFCFKEVQPRRVVEVLDGLRSLLPSISKDRRVVLVSIFGNPKSIVYNLLCHFQKVGIVNYVLLGPASDFLVELARFGHAVIGSDNADNRLNDLEREFSLKAQVIKKSLELGFDTWLVEGNVVPIVNAFSETVNPGFDFWASLGSQVFFARSSLTSLKTWSDVMNDVLTSPSGSFVSSVVDVLRKRGFGKVLTEEISGFNFFALSDVRDMNEFTLSEKGTKLMYWQLGTPEDAVKLFLGRIGFWLLDGDSSCKAVYCHR